MSVIYLVRHGQASFGAEEYDRLSPLGVRQSRVLGAALRDRVPKPDRVVTGTMTRHRDTAAECLGTDVTPEVDPRWDEYDHRDVIVPHWPDLDGALARWVTADTGYRETWAAFSSRVCAAVDELATSLGRSRTALVFTSGGPISAAAARLLGGDRDLWLNLSRVTVNTGITKLVYGRRGTSLVSFNDHCHLDGELLTYR